MKSKQNTLKPVVAGLAAALAVLAASAPQAQVMRPVLDFKTADAIRGHCLARASEAGYNIAIAVFDQGGNLVSFANNDAKQAVAEVALWKGRSAALYLTPTVQTATWNLPTAPMISIAEGGVPLFTAEGIGVGGVGVSGAPSAFDAECGALAAESVGLAVRRGDG